jgi:hypothetical protein
VAVELFLTFSPDFKTEIYRYPKQNRVNKIFGSFPLFGLLPPKQLLTCNCFLSLPRLQADTDCKNPFQVGFDDKHKIDNDVDGCRSVCLKAKWVRTCLQNSHLRASTPEIIL